MARSYSVAIAALAIDAPSKWIDNLLSQHPIPEVVVASRGVSRRIPYPVLLRLALSRQLHVGLGLAVRDALVLARELLAEPGEAAEIRRGVIRIGVDRAEVERELDRRLREVLESAPATRRGRPARRRRET